MKVKVMKNGKEVASSKNLEVIMRYQRGYGKPYIKSMIQRGHTLYVRYSDGASVKTDFADSSLLKNWIDSKKRHGVF